MRWQVSNECNYSNCLRVSHYALYYIFVLYEFSVLFGMRQCLDFSIRNTPILRDAFILRNASASYTGIAYASHSPSN
jgi:hypothetical protein